MLIDRSHKNWVLFTLGASAVSMGLFAWYRSVTLQNGGRSPSGASLPGLIWGVLALGVIIFCCLLGVRKKVRIWRLGRAKTWMTAHIWLGLLSVPLVLCHTGMKLGNNLTLAIMILFGIVILSGIVGLALQAMIPAMLLDRVKAEATFEQIERVYEILRTEADEIVAGVCGPLDAAGTHAVAEAAPAAALVKAAVVAAAAAKAAPPGSKAALPAAPPLVPEKRGGTVMVMKSKGAVQGKTPKERGKVSGPVEGAEPLKQLYLSEVRPFLALGSPKRSRLMTSQGSISVFEYARTLLPANLHDVVDDLASICEERRQLALQEHLHAWLHGWLFIHAPLSYLLLALTLIHAVVAPLWY